jgi:pimeloyl-ACP methyl ester carboxylesterase
MVRGYSEGLLMQPLFEHRPRYAGYRTRALELEGEGPPVLLIHGYADSADTWRLVLDRFARAGRAAVALDLPGFAEADPLDERRPILEQQSEFVAAAVRAVAPKGGEVVVAGNSLGGLLSIRAAQDASLPIAGIAPIAPAGFDLARWIGIIEREPVLRRMLALPLPIPPAVVRQAVGRVYPVLAFHRPGAVDPQWVSSFTRHHRDRATVRRYLDTAKRLYPELADCFELEKISCPALLIWGDRDRMVSHRGARRMLEALPETEYVELADVGHCPQIEAAERVSELLLAFPASARGRRAAA